MQYKGAKLLLRVVVLVNQLVHNDFGTSRCVNHDYTSTSC